MNPDAIRDIFAAVGPVAIRRMFGGQGLYLDGLMFGLVARGEIYLKADAVGAARFTAAGSTPFTYRRGEREVALGYWRAPADALDDPDAMRDWSTLALAAARATARRPRRAEPRGSKTAPRTRSRPSE